MWGWEDSIAGKACTCPGLILCTAYVSEHHQEWSQNVEPGVNPEYLPPKQQPIKESHKQPHKPIEYDAVMEGGMSSYTQEWFSTWDLRLEEHTGACQEDKV